MSIRNCIDEAVAGGDLNSDVAVALRGMLDQIIKDNPGSGRVWERNVANKLQREWDRFAQNKKRQNVKQAAAQKDIGDRLKAAKAEGKNVSKAARAVLTFDASNEFSGPNVYSRYEVLRGDAYSHMADFLEQNKSSLAGIKQNKGSMPKVVAALFGEASDGPSKAAADAIITGRNFLVERFNEAGGNIEIRQNWGWVQSHNANLISSAGKDAWKKRVLTLVDRDRMRNIDDEVMSDGDLNTFLDEMYDDIVAEEIGSFRSGVNPRSGNRALNFKGSKAWLEYNREFGSGEPFDAIVNEMDRLALDTAAMEIMGPSPRATLEMMKRTTDELEGAELNVGKELISLDSLFEEVIEPAQPFSRSGASRWMQGLRGLMTMSRLGSSVFSAVYGDTATSRRTAVLNGMGANRRTGAQMKMAFGGVENRRDAARMGYVSEIWLNSSMAQQRLQGELVKSGLFSRTLPEFTLRASGTSGWTEAQRLSFMKETEGLMTDMSEHGWDELADVNSDFRGFLERYGVDAGDWERYRDTPIWSDNEFQAEFRRPRDVWARVKNDSSMSIEEKRAHFDTAMKLQEMIRAESYFDTVQSTPTARAGVRARAPKGGFMDQVVLKNATLWKSFTISYSHLYASRLAGIGRTRGLASAAGFAVPLLVAMTVAGGARNWAVQIAAGKDPQDMDDGAFFTDALFAGGALGIPGDIADQINRKGFQGLVEFLVGPVVTGPAKDAFRLAADFADGDEDGNITIPAVTRDLLEVANPLSTLWYTRLANEKLVMDTVERAIDPEAFELRMHNRRSWAEREGMSYWSEPGDSLSNARTPEAPELPDVSVVSEAGAAEPKLGGFARHPSNAAKTFPRIGGFTRLQ